MTSNDVARLPRGLEKKNTISRMVPQPRTLIDEPVNAGISKPMDVICKYGYPSLFPRPVLSGVWVQISKYAHCSSQFPMFHKAGRCSPP